MYDCTQSQSCPIIKDMERRWGTCISCASGVSCAEKYGSYDGCGNNDTPITSCGCCVNANVCVEYEEGWDMYGCTQSQPCPDVEFWEQQSGPCNSCASGISCASKYGSYDGCNNDDTPTSAPTMTQSCLVLACCVEDCCGRGTTWDSTKELCVSTPSQEDGFKGSYSPAYKGGCAERSCCEESCCSMREGTVYSRELQSCVQA